MFLLIEWKRQTEFLINLIFCTLHQESEPRIVSGRGFNSNREKII